MLPCRRARGFGHELRAAGLAVGSGDVLDYCSAMGPLDPSDLVDLYWAGRTTLVTRRDDIAVYDQVFRRFFLGGGDPVPEVLTLRAQVDGASRRPCWRSRPPTRTATARRSSRPCSA